jgi:hypothetical protein
VISLVLVVRAGAGGVEDDPDVPEQACASGRRRLHASWHAHARGALARPSLSGSMPTKAAISRYLGGAQDLDHQVGADITGADNCDLDFSCPSAPGDGL